MRMQEVITKLREEAPLLEDRSKILDSRFEQVYGLSRDLEVATSEEGRKLLLQAFGKAMLEFVHSFRELRCSLETVCLLNVDYKEKIGPRGPRKPKDAPGQQMLPGMEVPECRSQQ